ncbi:MAG: hypothetical protein JO154_07390 [Chitinophaga sp.]|uniref:hypothetical protein n=1 Tax=Chitinophaga sp. TaxID=1869181 RepID=UPI0025C5EC6A|nr:hypothetical protein [Chitinophaga sp.]MBV8252416.1 hypothetical protein [Chitinophaga sp.]
MDKNYRSDELRKYFFRPNLKAPIIILALGLLVINYNSSQTKGFSELGWIATLIGLAWIGFAIYRIRTAPSDETVDGWFQEDLDNLVAAAYAKLGLEKEQIIKEPLVIFAPVYWPVYGIPDREVVFHKGKDKVLRFGVYRVTIFLLADHLLASYICDYNFIRKTHLNDRTHEYHYQDVVSVSTEEYSASYTLQEGRRLIKAQKFRLSVSSGDKIEVVVNPYSIADNVGGKLPPSGADQAVQVIRTMLRSKKVTRDQP